MTPLFDFRCQRNHVTTDLRSYEQRDRPLTCPTCGEPTERLFPRTHSPPSGVYSYEPNLGDPRAFEERHEAIKDHRMRGDP